MRKIAKTEKCDVYIVTIAALLYDNPMLEVITDEKFKKRGLAAQRLDYAKEIAIKENCCKMMLLTGSKKKVHWGFY